MQIYGKVISKETGEPVPYASVMLKNENGQYLGVGVQADQKGVFSIDSNIIQPGTNLVFSSSGYFENSVPYSQYTATQTFYLSTQIQTLSDVVVTATRATGGKLLLFAILAVVGYQVFKKDIKKAF